MSNAFTEFSEYRTFDGQRWDAIAFEAYGDPYRYEIIQFANPQYMLLAQLPGGVLLQVPVIEESAIEQSVPTELLPPWKR